MIKLDCSIKNNYVRLGLGTAAAGICAALVIILAATSAHGVFGHSAQALMEKKILPFLTGKVGPFPVWSVIFVASVVTTAFIFSAALYGVRKKANKEVTLDPLPEEVPKEAPPPSFETLPPYTRSAPPANNLSLPHVLYCLENDEKQVWSTQRDDIMLKSLSCRKFVAIGNSIDTGGHIEGSMLLDVHDHRRLKIDQKGYAFGSKRCKGDITFVKDESIIQVDMCTRYTECDVRQGELYMGYYKDGKCIIQQPGTRACVFTCAAMVLIDCGIPFDLNCLSRATLTETEALNSKLNVYGYQLELLTKEISTLEEWTKEKGSLLVGCSPETLGGHKIIVDSINEETVTMRDPYHGWRITLPLKKFMEEVKPTSYYGVVLKPKEIAVAPKANQSFMTRLRGWVTF